MKNKVLAILDRMIEDAEDILDFIKPVGTYADLSNDRMRKKSIEPIYFEFGRKHKVARAAGFNLGLN